MFWCWKRNENFSYIVFKIQMENGGRSAVGSGLTESETLMTSDRPSYENKYFKILTMVPLTFQWSFIRRRREVGKGL